MCEFGDKGPDRNRYQYCMSCNHEICGDCKKWTKDRTAETDGDTKLDDDESERQDESDSEDNEQSNGEEETRVEDGSNEFNAEQDDDDTYGRKSNNTSASGSVYSPDLSDFTDDSD